jgi:oligosaccharide repeat unit polymerase
MLVNPSFVFSFVWLSALFLYTRYWSDVFLILSNKTIYYILSAVFVSLFSWLFFIVVNKSLKVGFKRKIFKFSHGSEHKIIIFFNIWIIGTVIELLYFRDLPVLSLFGFSNMTYHDFGLPSLHGFLNAIILSISMYLLYKYILLDKKVFLIYYFLTLLVPIMGMNRGMLTSLLLQSLFVILVFKGLKLKLMLKICFYIVTFIFGFGMLGELRYNGNPDDLYQVFQISEKFPTFLPKSVMWVYMYVTSSINNIENIIDQFEDFSFNPYIAMFGLIPSIIRNQLDLPIQQNFVDVAFNVSSFMPNYLGSFGLYGSIFFYFFASMIAMSIYYRYINRYELRFGFTLVILLHSIALSIFSDFFAIQVYVFQVLIQFIIFPKIITKDRS